ncbi:MAG TPA: hypothetical protein VHQ24_05590 [Lachnospiraceae bacterium]|nr:hypothetical protein [Lachnospiraceae bacterium]
MSNYKKNHIFFKGQILLMVVFLVSIVLFSNKAGAANIVTVNNNGKERSITKEEFLKENGFNDEKPFYKYYNENGKIQLELYYNNSSKKGCGIRYTYYNDVKGNGFTFKGYQQQKGFTHKKYSLIPEDREAGDGSKYVTGYKTSKKYDVINNSKKIIKFTSTGVLEYGDNAIREKIVSISFTYDKKGKLKKKECSLNSYIYGTSESSYVYYYDNQERPMYKSSYMSHGSLESYFIYNGKSKTPSYILLLDDNLGTFFPQFIKVTK